MEHLGIHFGGFDLGLFYLILYREGLGIQFTLNQ